MNETRATKSIFGFIQHSAFIVQHWGEPSAARQPSLLFRPSAETTALERRGRDAARARRLSEAAATQRHHLQNNPTELWGWHARNGS